MVSSVVVELLTGTMFELYLCMSLIDTYKLIINKIMSELMTTTMKILLFLNTTLSLQYIQNEGKVISCYSIPFVRCLPQ